MPPGRTSISSTTVPSHNNDDIPPMVGDLLTTLCSFFDNMGSIRGSAAALAPEAPRAEPAAGGGACVLRVNTANGLPLAP